MVLSIISIVLYFFCYNKMVTMGYNMWNFCSSKIEYESVDNNVWDKIDCYKLYLFKFSL